MKAIYSVTELNQELKTILELTYKEIQIKGEISGFSRSSAGHCYFNLIEKNSLLRAVLFKNRNLANSSNLVDGTQVTVTGSLTLYEKSGSYQIIVKNVVASGLGDQLQIFEELKKKLQQRGIFDESRKKNIPILLNRVAIITSPTGAVIRDILSTLKKRQTVAHIRIFPAPVQGMNAAQKITQHIEYINQHQLSDVIILARGGGSIEDLMPFSEEILVMAVANSEIPIISGVGHETDFSLADFAADLRVSTPTAAAEIVSQTSINLQEKLNRTKEITKIMLNAKLTQIKQQLQISSQKVLKEKLENQLDLYKYTIDRTKEDILQKLYSLLHNKKHQVSLINERIAANSPTTLLKQGYVKVKDDNGDYINSIKDVPLNKRLTLSLIDGKIIVEAKEKVDYDANI